MPREQRNVAQRCASGRTCLQQNSREWRVRQLETAKEKKIRQEQIQALRMSQVFFFGYFANDVSFKYQSNGFSKSSKQEMY